MRARIGLTMTVAGLLVGSLAGEASAAGVSVTSAKRLVFAAAAGEVNRVTISPSGAGVIVSDAGAALTAGAGCTLDNANQATCPNVILISATLGDGNDVFDNNTAIPSHVSGNAGDDTIRGGTGDDTLLGEGGIDQIYAREGNDVINSRGGLADLVDCGPGQDTLAYDSLDHISSSCETGAGTPPPAPGPGEAPAPSSGAPTPAAVILPSPPGTADPIAVPAGRCPVQFLGAVGADRIDGTGRGDRMFGGDGNDVLNGLGGSDCLFGMRGRDALYGGAGADRLRGGGGPDVLVSGPGDDRLWGEAGGDRLSGGQGRDRLVGGPGRDRLRGGAGRDAIVARDGARDVIDCGPGRDVARVDRIDRVRRCERVVVGR